MRLDTIALVIIIIFGVLWLAIWITGLLTAIPFGIFGLGLIAIALALLIMVIYQRLTNAEDDYYDKNIDQ